MGHPPALGRGWHRHPGPASTSSSGSGLHTGRKGATTGLCRCLLFGDGGRRLFCQLGSYLCSPGCWFWFRVLIRGSQQQLETKCAPRSATCRVCVDGRGPHLPVSEQLAAQGILLAPRCSPNPSIRLGLPRLHETFTSVPHGTQGQKVKPDPMGLQMGLGGRGSSQADQTPSS